MAVSRKKSPGQGHNITLHNSINLKVTVFQTHCKRPDPPLATTGRDLTQRTPRGAS